MCKKMAALTIPDAKTNQIVERWVRNIINDGVEASARKSQARFQIVHVSSSAEPRI